MCYLLEGNYRHIIHTDRRLKEVEEFGFRDFSGLEVLVDAERRSALTTLQELGACPRHEGAGSFECRGPGAQSRGWELGFWGLGVGGFWV